MNNRLQSDSEAVQATYMTQAEANEVMELWASRQREDASRQSMVTIHDVAEATQLTPQEIQRYLQEVRTAKPTVTKTFPVPSTPPKELAIWPALVRVGPTSGVVALIIFLVMVFEPRHPYAVGYFSLFWSVAMFFAYSIWAICRLVVAAQGKKAADDLESMHSASPYRNR